jgi:hypothetical protein
MSDFPKNERFHEVTKSDVKEGLESNAELL